MTAENANLLQTYWFSMTNDSVRVVKPKVLNIKHFVPYIFNNNIRKLWQDSWGHGDFGNMWVANHIVQQHSI